MASESEKQFIKHPLILEGAVEQRLYQLNIVSGCIKKNSLVVLPTSLGKTIVALLIMVMRLEKIGGKVLLLSPTKPLVEQHHAFYSRVLNPKAGIIRAFTGSTTPDKRREMWQESSVIIATPQVIENDLINNRISLNDVSCIVFDEAHRSVGNYAYTYIAEKYAATAESPLILGITASPGSEKEKIDDVCRALFIENVIVKTEEDADIKPYVHKKEIEWVSLPLPKELADIRDLLKKILDMRMNKLAEYGYPLTGKYLSKRDLLALQSGLAAETRSGDADPNLYSAVSVLAEIMKIEHGAELIETQGAQPLLAYLKKIDDEAGAPDSSKAAKRIVADLYFRQALQLTEKCETEHPKFRAVQQIISRQLAASPDSKVIVFTNFRDTANIVREALLEVPDVRPIRFVGQGSRHKDKGLTQKQQTEIIEQFRAGVYNVLIATSVAEEGLDIPATDMVLFYEPVPSEIRSIQRRGRTGRFQAGRVIVLVTKGTRDEAYRWSSQNKEKRMLSEMKNLKKTFSDEPVSNASEGCGVGSRFGSLFSNESVSNASKDRGAFLNESVSNASESRGVFLDESVYNASKSRMACSNESVCRVSENPTALSNKSGNNAPENQKTFSDFEREFKEKYASARSQTLGANENVSGSSAGSAEEINLSDAVFQAPDMPPVRSHAFSENFGADEAGFAEPKEPVLKILADTREIKSGVMRRLEAQGLLLRTARLDVADYVVSDDMAVERKTAADFAASLIDGKRNLFSQLIDLSRAYKKAVLIVEGMDEAAAGSMNRNSIRGALLSIEIDLNVSIFYTKDEEETALLLKMMAKKEQINEKKSVNPHGKKPAKTTGEQQEYVLSSISGVGPHAAQILLNEFGSLNNIFNASEEELCRVKGIGKKTAQRIREVVEADYKK